MNRLFLTLLTILTAVSASAQYNYPHSGNNDILLPAMRNTINGRTEIFIPQVNGYNVYKADLHTHTICSDGRITPEQRVREAWQDGLDILAIADHMEYRRYEKHFVEFLQEYFPEAVKVKHNSQDASEIKVDLSIGSTNTPSMSVKNTNFSAPMAVATAQAASSALIL